MYIGVRGVVVRLYIDKVLTWARDQWMRAAAPGVQLDMRTSGLHMGGTVHVA